MSLRSKEKAAPSTVMMGTGMYLGDYVLRDAGMRELDRVDTLAKVGDLFVRHPNVHGNVYQEPIHNISNALPIDITQKLGEGSFGVAYATRYHGRALVLKKSKRIDDVARQDAHHEAEIAQRLLEGPTALKLFSAGTPCNALDRANGMKIARELALMHRHLGYRNIHPIVHLDDASMSIVSVTCDGDLRNLRNLRLRGELQLSSPSEVPALWQTLSKQVMNGINYMHSMGVAHLDVKLDNIFYRDKSSGYECFISDFGMSTLDRTATGIQGTMIMMAPELFSGRPYDTQLADMYSVGMTLLDLLYLPFSWSVHVPSQNRDDTNRWAATIRQNSATLSAGLLRWSHVTTIQTLAELINPVLALDERSRLYNTLTTQLGAQIAIPMNFDLDTPTTSFTTTHDTSIPAVATLPVQAPFTAMPPTPVAVQAAHHPGGLPHPSPYVPRTHATWPSQPGYYGNATPSANGPRRQLSLPRFPAPPRFSAPAPPNYYGAYPPMMIGQQHILDGNPYGNYVTNHPFTGLHGPYAYDHKNINNRHITGLHDMHGKLPPFAGPHDPYANHYPVNNINNIDKNNHTHNHNRHITGLHDMHGKPPPPFNNNNNNNMLEHGHAPWQVEPRLVLV